jgi:hypothetical protein
MAARKRGRERTNPMMKEQHQMTLVPYKPPASVPALSAPVPPEGGVLEPAPRRARMAVTMTPQDESNLCAAIAAGITPLEYMLEVMRDRGADKERRDSMAFAAAPYAHARLGTTTAARSKRMRVMIEKFST